MGSLPVFVNIMVLNIGDEFLEQDAAHNPVLTVHICECALGVCLRNIRMCQSLCHCKQKNPLSFMLYDGSDWFRDWTGTCLPGRCNSLKS